MDDRETLARFKKELKAPFPFLPDPEGKLAELYGVKGEKMATRKTFVIDENRKVVSIEEGSAAIDPDESIASCPLHKRKGAPASPATSSAPEKKKG
jgi:peroxiredoxin